MFSIFGSQRSQPITSFKQDLSRLISRNLAGHSGEADSDEIAQAIIEKTYSFDYQVGSAYDSIVDQYGPTLIAPIVFTLATKSWKSEHADGLGSTVQRQSARHGFFCVKCIIQCLDYPSWLNIRNGFVNGSITHNGYTGVNYGSPESAGRIADDTRRLSFWIAAGGLMQFVRLPSRNPANDFTSENASLLKTALQALASVPDQGMFLNYCRYAVDDWLEKYATYQSRR